MKFFDNIKTVIRSTDDPVVMISIIIGVLTIVIAFFIGVIEVLVYFGVSLPVAPLVALLPFVFYVISLGIKGK